MTRNPWDVAHTIRCLILALIITCIAPFFIIGGLTLFNADPLLVTEPLLAKEIGYSGLAVFLLALGGAAYYTHKFFVRVVLGTILCITVCYSLLPFVVAKGTSIGPVFFVALLPLVFALLTSIIVIAYVCMHTNKPRLVARELGITLFLAILFVMLTLWYAVDTVDEDILLALALALFVIGLCFPIPAVGTACIIESLTLFILIWWYISAFIEELFGAYALGVLGVSILCSAVLLLVWYDDTDKSHKVIHN